MKRITQILASVLFIITVLTVYLAFDFAISSAVSHKTASHKRSLRHHDHPHDEIKSTRKRSITPQVFHPARKSNNTLKNRNEHDGHQSNNERQLRPIKPPLRAKPGGFHKGKTGVKVNKPQKSNKDQRKRLSTSTPHSQQKDRHQLDADLHV